MVLVSLPIKKILVGLIHIKRVLEASTSNMWILEGVYDNRSPLKHPFYKKGLQNTNIL